MKNRKIGRLGFTLIELLVVVLILGILSGIALPQYQKSILKAKISEAWLNVHQLQKSVDLYYLTYRKCPRDLKELENLPAGLTAKGQGEILGNGNYSVRMESQNWEYKVEVSYIDTPGGEVCKIQAVPVDIKKIPSMSIQMHNSKALRRNQERNIHNRCCGNGDSRVAKICQNLTDGSSTPDTGSFPKGCWYF